MIVVEGPDGGGKTTLIKDLSEYWGVPVAPRVVSKDAEAMVDLKQWVADNLKKGWHSTIYDRHRLVSETIYGPILRPSKPEPGFDDTAWLTMSLKRFYQIQPIIIYCLPPLEVVKANVMDDPDNLVVRDRISAIYAMYQTRAAIDISVRGRTTDIWDYTSDGREQFPLRVFEKWSGIVNNHKESTTW